MESHNYKYSIIGWVSTLRYEKQRRAYTPCCRSLRFLISLIFYFLIFPPYQCPWCPCQWPCQYRCVSISVSVSIRVRVNVCVYVRVRAWVSPCQWPCSCSCSSWGLIGTVSWDFSLRIFSLKHLRQSPVDTLKPFRIKFEMALQFESEHSERFFFFNRTYRLFPEYSALLQYFERVLLLWNTNT